VKEVEMAKTPGNARLQPGDPAPEVGLGAQDGTVVTLASLKGRKVLLYFYPKADTPG
jgi:peroxiredoxin Q/BCP